MPISKNIWRFQCDPNGDPDPTVLVYLRSRTTVDGVDFVQDSMTPVPMKFSELTGGVSDLVNVAKISAKADQIKAIAIGNPIEDQPAEP